MASGAPENLILKTWITGIGVYLVYHHLRGQRANKALFVQLKEMAPSKPQHHLPTDAERDPFASIREKRTLRSKADFLVENSELNKP